MLRKRNAQENEAQEKDRTLPKPAMKKKGSNVFLKIVVITIFILYVVIPLLVYFSPTVRRHAVFLHYVSLSAQRNLSLPEASGLKCTKSFFTSFPDGTKVGAWYIPASSLLHKCSKSGVLPLDEEFSDQRPVFLYLHGNAGSRAGGHRVELYKVLSEKLDAHVVAFDYRGYADSSRLSPTESVVVEDTKLMYDWLLKRVKPSRVFIWGHSLGTGVGVAFLSKMTDMPQQPAGLILEAPFTTILDAAKYHPLSIFHRFMPFFDFFIAKPIGDNDTGFDSLNRISQVKCPILILHAEDDGFVPFEHGKKLYEVALKTRKHLDSDATQFASFDGKLDFGHKNIYKSPELPSIIKKFMDKVKPKFKKV